MATKHYPDYNWPIPNMKTIFKRVEIDLFFPLENRPNSVV